MSDTLTPKFGELGQVSFTVTDIDRAVVFLRDIVGLFFCFKSVQEVSRFSCSDRCA